MLAVASGGGHWVQLRRIVPAFEGFEIVYVTTDSGYHAEVPRARFYTVPDANRWNRKACVVLALRLARLVWEERPEVVVSTGAAPGCLAILFGRLMGARTVWVDSVANVSSISLSGRIVAPVVHLLLTQWPHLARPGGAEYAGSVL